MRPSLLAVVLLMLAPGTAAAQQPPSGGQQPPRVEERVEVVGVTPIHGIGLEKSKVPANVQVFTVEELRTPGLDVATLLTQQGAGVQVSETQGGAFQPDVLFRGFAGSPLLGASEGLAVYQDGVRINDPFGDTVHWDMLPSSAIASINLIPGSNPLFGLNALGGALSIRTKSGFDFPRRRASFTAGSFGRRHIDAESGAHGESFGYYVAGGLTDESGWRDFSPSTIRRVFGDFAWRGLASAVNIGVTAASNDLIGNGAAPVELLDDQRDAVFTHPDRTDNDGVLLTTKARRQTSERVFVEGVAYYRHTRNGTFNGDAADDDPRDDNQEFDDINNISHTRGRATGGAAQVTRTAPFLGRDNHLILGAGLDAAVTRFDFSTELAHLTADRGTTGAGIFDDDDAVDLHSRILLGSVFGTNTWSLTEALAVTGGARFNWTSLRLRDQLGTALTGDHRYRRISPAAGVTYRVRPWLDVYGSYAQSARVPTPVELTCADPEDPCRLPNAFVSDPPLDEIVASTWEAGGRGNARTIEWSVAAFETTSADDIIFVSSGTLRGEGHFENVAETERRGVEATIKYSLAERLSAFATYAMQKATFGTDLRIASRFHPEAVDVAIAVTQGDRLPGVPVHSAKFGITGTVRDRLALGLNLRAQSGQFLRGDEANLLTPIPGFMIANVQARQRIVGPATAIVEVQNIFDANYYTFGVLGDAAPVLGDDFDNPRFYAPGSPRAAWIGLEVQF